MFVSSEQINSATIEYLGVLSDPNQLCLCNYGYVYSNA